MIKFYCLSEVVEWLIGNHFLDESYVLSVDLICGQQPYTIVLDTNKYRLISPNGNRRRGYFSVEEIVDRLLTDVNFNGQVLTLAHFSRSRTVRLFGTSEPNRAHRATDVENLRLNRAANIEERAEYDKQYHAIYNKENADKIRARHRRYNMENADTISAKKKEYHLKVKDAYDQKLSTVWVNDVTGEELPWSTLQNRIYKQGYTKEDMINLGWRLK